MSITEARCEIVNDLHSRMNSTAVRRVYKPRTLASILNGVLACADAGLKISMAGGRHSMGAQQFATDAVLFDMSEFNRPLRFDRERGLVEVEAGITWPKLIEYLCSAQSGSMQKWSIAQKQTGADRLSIGGAASANIHGRGLSMKPFVGDIEALSLVDASGALIRCDRANNAELFRLAIGGYGLFGLIASVTLRLVPRVLLRRRVEMIEVDQLMARMSNLVSAGFLYGDFQFAIDDKSPEFMQLGILSAYQPVEIGTLGRHEVLSNLDGYGEMKQRTISPAGWQELVCLAHLNKSEAFSKYAIHYLATDGQLYWSDLFQLSTYLDNYHDVVDARTLEIEKGTEIISELYVARADFAQFMKEAAGVLRLRNADLIYGTVRLIERDDETFLPWARDRSACLVLNIHTKHTDEGIASSKRIFRELIDLVSRYGGNYYLTYHKFASKEQLERCYPEFQEFLVRKKQFDRKRLFESDWYRHYSD